MIDRVHLRLGAIGRAGVLAVGKRRDIDSEDVAHLPGVNKGVDDIDGSFDEGIGVRSKEAEVRSMGQSLDAILVDTILGVLKVKDIFHLTRINRNTIKIGNVHKIARSRKGFDLSLIHISEPTRRS